MTFLDYFVIYLVKLDDNFLLFDVNLRFFFKFDLNLRAEVGKPDQQD